MHNHQKEATKPFKTFILTDQENLFEKRKRNRGGGMTEINRKIRNMREK
jgi:hypothetical protein